jgi:hypothetical protein
MPKSSSSVVELNPSASGAPKPRKRASSASLAAAQPKSSSLKPILIGLGVGAAVATTALVVRSQLKPRRSAFWAQPQPSLFGVLAKAAALALGRLAVQRAAAALAERGPLTLADAWQHLARPHHAETSNNVEAPAQG